MTKIPSRIQFESGQPKNETAGLASFNDPYMTWHYDTITSLVQYNCKVFFLLLPFSPSEVVLPLLERACFHILKIGAVN